VHRVAEPRHGSSSTSDRSELGSGNGRTCGARRGDPPTRAVFFPRGRGMRPPG
jgi:hypothetical protein